MNRPLLLCALCVLALSACDAAPPAPAKPAQTQADQQDEEATALRDHIQTPIDKAKGVEDIQAAHDAQQADDIDAQAAGEDAPADAAGQDPDDGN